MYILSVALINVFFACASNAQPENGVWETKGEAIDPVEERVIFRERRATEFLNGNPQKTIVRYFSPSGKELTKRVVTYANRLNTPSYAIEYPFGRSEWVTVAPDKIILGKRGALGTEETRVFPYGEDVVVDEGMYFFLRENWSRLLAGETIEFRLAAASRLDLIPFSIRVTEDANDYIELTLKPDSRLLRIAFGSVTLIFDRSGDWLKRYSGISDVWENSFGRYVVDTRYEKPIPVE